MPPLPVVVALQAIVLGAFVAEAAIGFGATVIAVTLAVLLVPLTTILPAFVPINMVLSAVLVARGRRSLRLALLGREIAPAVVVGLAVGLWVFRRQRLDALALAFAVFVVAMSVVELRRVHRGGAPSTPLGAGPRRVLLALGGFVHGLFGTGGPMIVYVMQRRGLDKAAFRASLALVWLVLNAALMINFAQLRLLDAPSLRLSAALGLALLPSLWLGERLHHRLSPRRFQLGVFVLLLIAGLALGVRTALKLLVA